MRLHQFSLRALLLMMAYYCVLFALVPLLLRFFQPYEAIPVVALLVIVPPLSLLPTVVLAKLIVAGGLLLLCLTWFDIPEMFDFTILQSQWYEALGGTFSGSIMFAFLLSVRYSAQKEKYFAQLREAWLTAFPFWRRRP